MIDTAYSNDPRIKKIAEEKKQKKLQEKKAKEDAIKEKERVSYRIKFISSKF